MGALGSEVVISRSELLVALAQGSSSGNIFLSPVKFTWLQVLAKAFELWRPTRIQVEWRPATATTTSGTVAYGIDWAKPQLKDVGAITRPQVLALTPVMDGPVWRGSRLNIPASVLSSRKWYEVSTSDFTSDTGPGSLAYHSSKDDGVGEFWLHYTIHFYGTRSA